MMRSRQIAGILVLGADRVAPSACRRSLRAPSTVVIPKSPWEATTTCSRRTSRTNRRSRSTRLVPGWSQRGERQHRHGGVQLDLIPTARSRSMSVGRASTSRSTPATRGLSRRTQGFSPLATASASSATPTPCVAHQGTHRDAAPLRRERDGLRWRPSARLRPDAWEDGTFSWSNGSRLYYTNLTSASSVSDGTVPRVRGDHRLPMDVPRERRHRRRGRDARGERGQLGRSGDREQAEPTVFSDKEQMWADQNEDSPVLRQRLHLLGRLPQPEPGQRRADLPFVATSSDGGDSWTQKQVTRLRTISSTRSKASGGRVARFDRQRGRRLRDGAAVRGRYPGRRQAHLDQVVQRREELDSATGAVRRRRCVLRGPVRWHELRCVMDGVAVLVTICRHRRASTSRPPRGAPTSFTKRGRTDGPEALVRRSTTRRSSGSRIPRTMAARDAIRRPITAGDRPYYAAVAVSSDGTDSLLNTTRSRTPTGPTRRTHEVSPA